MANVVLASNDGLFELTEEEWYDAKDNHIRGLRLKSKGLAEKHVVEVRLEMDFDSLGGRFYRGAYVSHGMRMCSDTLDETIEYIKVLESAADFAHRVIFYMKTHGWFKEESK